MNSLTADTKDILRGWAAIARYLGRGVRTVQRWEAELQLPLRRNGRTRRGERVVTTTGELDRWVANTLAPRLTEAADGSSPSPDTPARNRINVLVVEDSVKDLSTCVELLNRMGVREVEAASTIASALSRLEQARSGRLPIPDLIILDLLFSVESGYEVLRYCRQHKELRSVPIVVWSTVGEARSELSEVFGVKAVVAKGAGAADLESAALKAIKARRMTAG